MPANYVLLQRIELNASAASVTFANIPQSGYTDLKVVFSARTDNNPDSNGYGLAALSVNGTSTSFTNRRLITDTGGGLIGSFTSTNTNTFVIVNGSSLTSNTFANSEIYFPNYNVSGVNKSFSIDTVNENNAAQNWLGLYAGLWNNTAAITSIGFTATSGNFVANSTFSLYGLAAVGTTPVIAPKATGGNLIENDGTYWIHTFYSTGTFTPLTGLTCDALVVAGGGAGGGGSSAGNPGAGGGAGGFRTATGLSISTAQTVTVGAGGAGVSNATGNSGSSSVFASITSAGGGGGATAVGTGTPTAGLAGGSSGGVAAWNPTSNLAGTAPSPAGQGNAGGGIFSAGNNGRAGAGGGGAGAAGSNGDTNGGIGGAGGAGTASSISGTSVTYAGGGGGSGTSGSTGAGGAGGGGAGANGLSAGNAGTANTGGGGGGLRDGGGSGLGGNGGSGIVIIRYPIA